MDPSLLGPIVDGLLRGPHPAHTPRARARRSAARANAALSAACAPSGGRVARCELTHTSRPFALRPCGAHSEKAGFGRGRV
eukprot:6254566-Prymnesium_polylepis.1